MLSDTVKNENTDNTSEEDDITIIELEGKRYEIVQGKDYVAITPFDEDLTEDGDTESDFTILEISEDPVDETGCILKTVDDEELYSEIGDLFLSRFAEDEPDDE